MADEELQLKKITELSESANATDGNLFAIGDETSGNLKKITTKSLSQSLLGDTDISEIGDGTVKGAINTIRRGEVDTSDSIATFDSGDDESPETWTDVELIKSGETHSSLFHKISTMVKNVRWIMSRLGNTDISSIGDGTVTGSINTVQTDVNNKYSELNSALAAISISDFTQSNITVAYNYGYTDVTFSVSRSGYTPLGVVGWWVVNSSTDGSGSTRCSANRLRLSGSTVTARLVCSASSTDAKVDMTIVVLYKAA